MKRIATFITLALSAALAVAATLSPIQLLNPAGSTSGQAIVSTGSSTAPAWGTVTAGTLSPVAANTVIANPTAGTASPVAHAVPSCSAANSALKWTTSTGLACGTTFALTSGNLSQFASTTSAQLAALLSDETGTGANVFGTSPTLTTPNIVGTTTNNNAAAGSVGEYVESQVSTVAITSGATINVTSISLTAGDWDLDGNCYYNAGAGASVSAQACAVSTASVTFPANRLRTLYSYSGAAAVAQSAIAPTQRVSIASTTTVYLIGFANYAGGTVTVDGIIRARRVR